MKVLAVVVFVALGLATASADTKMVVRGSNMLTSQLAAPLAEAYGQKHPAASFDIASSDEDAVKTLIRGGTTVALSTRLTKEIYKVDSASDLPHPTAVAFVGLMLVANSANGVDRVTGEQAEKIFTGKLKNWSALGGAGGPIILYAVRQNLTLLNDSVTVPVEDMSDDNQVAAAVAQDAHGLGFVTTLGLAGVKVLDLDEVKPSMATLRNRSYPFSWPIYFFTRGLPAGEAKDFLWYILSPEGQDVVEKAGFGSLK